MPTEPAHLNVFLVIASFLVGIGGAFGGIKAGVWFLKREIDRDRVEGDSFRKDVWDAIKVDRDKREDIDKRITKVEAICKERERSRGC